MGAQARPNEILPNVSLDFADRLSSAEVENHVSSLERRTKEQFPDIKRIFIKPQRSALNAEPPLELDFFSQRMLPSFSARCLDTENMSQAEMNMAAITGPMTNPLRPKVAIPPNVEISTT